MRHMKKMVALLLVVMSVMAVALPAMADYRPWADRWNLHTIQPNTFPEEGSELRTQIANLQGDLNTLRGMYNGLSYYMSTYAFSPLTVDGLYGSATTNAIKKVQGYFGLTVDGYCGVNTKNTIWNALGFTPVAD